MILSFSPPQSSIIEENLGLPMPKNNNIKFVTIVILTGL